MGDFGPQKERDGNMETEHGHLENMIFIDFQVPS